MVVEYRDHNCKTTLSKQASKLESFFQEVRSILFLPIILVLHIEQDPLIFQLPRSMTTTTTSAAVNHAYGETWYWDNRYSNEPATFDWYQKYPSLAPIINLYVPRNHRILVVGCGNSAFGEGMVNDGYEDVVNIDISSVVIEAMQNKYQNRSQLKYMKMDVRNMGAFESDSFGAVIDKGTLDSLLCGSNSRLNASMMLEEVWRVLKDKGVYILVTYGAPLYRLRLLKDSCLWNIKLHVIEKVALEEKSNGPVWELTNPIPLNDDGSSVEQALGKNPDVHYIYICVKDECLESSSNT